MEGLKRQDWRLWRRKEFCFGTALDAGLRHLDAGLPWMQDCDICSSLAFQSAELPCRFQTHWAHNYISQFLKHSVRMCVGVGGCVYSIHICNPIGPFSPENTDQYSTSSMRIPWQPPGLSLTFYSSLFSSPYVSLPIISCLFIYLCTCLLSVLPLLPLGCKSPESKYLACLVNCSAATS